MRYAFSDIYGERIRPSSIGGFPFTDPSQMARDWMGQAAGTYGRMQAGQKTKINPPGKTFGGALYSAGGGGVAGATTASMMGAAGGTAAGGTAGGTAAGSAGGAAASGAASGSWGGWIGAGVGALLGLASYLFS